MSAARVWMAISVRRVDRINVFIWFLAEKFVISRTGSCEKLNLPVPFDPQRSLLL